MTDAELLALAAAAASAVCGAFSAVAAFRSAASAREAVAAQKSAERRHALREISVAAASVGVELDRVRRCAEGLNTAYDTAMVFSGSMDHSGILEMKSRVVKRVEALTEISRNADRFLNAEATLRLADHDEFQRVLGRLLADLTHARSHREELEHELAARTARNEEQARGRLPITVPR